MKKLLTTLIIITLLACGTGPTVTGTETTNGPGIIAISLSQSYEKILGKTQPGAIISCVDADYRPFYDNGYDTTIEVGQDSIIEITGMKPGYYSIIATYEEQRLILQDVEVFDPSSKPIPTPIFKEYGKTETIKGRVRKNGNLVTDELIYIQGTPLYGITSKEGTFIIENVPASDAYTLILTPKEPAPIDLPNDTIPLSLDTDGPSWENLEIDIKEKGSFSNSSINF